MFPRRPLPLSVPSLLAVLALAAPCLANPIPEGALLVHVQPVDPGWCSAGAIATCDEIVQYTEMTGELEFDLFVYSTVFDPGTAVYRLLTTVEWPASWTVLDAHVCELGLGDILMNGNQAQLDITWPDCPPMNGYLFHAARFVVDVEGHGHFGDPAAFSEVYMGCPPDGMTMGFMNATAEAGVECGYCFTPCDFQFPCHPVPDTELLALEVRQGETTTAQVHVPIYGGPMGWPCTPLFASSVAWMEVSYEEIGWNDYAVTLDIDTAALAQGAHEGWMRVTDQCTGCTRVLLEVLPPVSSAPDDPARERTWGQVKALYRH
ncbi:MAG: hypothetical protein PVF43_04385 [Candidatus Eiseniibacteriota bacterium]|jgi:hypothetical protein